MIDVDDDDVIYPAAIEALARRIAEDVHTDYEAHRQWLANCTDDETRTAVYELTTGTLSLVDHVAAAEMAADESEKESAHWRGIAIAAREALGAEAGR